MLLEDYAAFLICALIGALLVFGVLNRRAWLKAASFAIAVGILAFHITAWRVQYVWAWVFPHPSVVVVSVALVIGPIAALLVGLGQFVPKKNDRRALLILTLFFILYNCYLVARQLIPPGKDTATWWYGDVLMQSSDSTCIAAAGATYLRTLGVEATERECVLRGLISREGGTDLNTWRMLSLMLPDGYVIRAGPVRPEDMARSGHWYLISTKWAFGVGHEVVIKVKPNGDDVIVRDPLGGEVTVPWEEVEERWFGRAVWAEKPR